MRNIEEIAAEEEARVRALRGRSARAFCWVLGLGMAVWGWILFSQGGMEKGALLILLSLLSFSLSWEGFSFPPWRTATLAALVAGGYSFFLYYKTALPSFYWGKDPDFWLSVHAGAIPDPPWSPLAYLLGQAACGLLPAQKFTLLPVLSGAVLSLCILFIVLEYVRRLRTKSALGTWMALATASALCVSLPFWNVGTLASGLTASLGLLLFLLQRSLLDREERPWRALGLLLGLLFAVHPLWGFLGLLRHLGSLDPVGRRLSTLWFPFFLGISPFLWILLRAGRAFPSWGGENPFWEVLKGWNGPWASKVAAGFEPGSAFGAFGIIVGALTFLVIVLLLLSTFRWKSAGRSITEPMDFWTGILAGGAGILFFSSASEALCPVALWFPVGVGGILVRLLERGWEKRQVSWGSGPRLAGFAVGILALSIGGAWVLGERCLRSGYFLPLQHSFNLLRTLPEPQDDGTGWPGGTLLVCEDPFEASACSEARLIQPFKLKALILERRYLNRKWMVTQCIRWEPRLLFSTAEGSTLGILRSLVQDNGDLWEVHWAVSELSDALGMGPATPTVLTQAFRKGGVSQEALNAQYHYDLTPLLVGREKLDRLSLRCLARYASGFHELGRRLLVLERYPQAIQAFERSTKLDPEYLEPQMQLSDLYAKKNILEAARLEFEKVVKTHPGRIAQLMKEMEKEGGMEDPKAAGWLDELIQLNGELAQAQYQLYRIFDKQGRGAEARALLEASAKNDPKRIEVQLALGRQMIKMGRPVKAEEAFRAVLLIDPQNKEAQKELWRLLNK